MVSTLPSPALPVKARGLSARIESALAAALSLGPGEGCPPRLASALQYAVFPAGGRVRPQLCLLTAMAVGDTAPVAADGAAAAVELIHCASLVHDDLPCFDDADRRRGKPSVHRVYGEALAVLAGDGLILLAFEVLTRHAAESRCIRDLVS